MLSTYPFKKKRKEKKRKEIEEKGSSPIFWFVIACINALPLLMPSLLICLDINFSFS